jgi:hypothetical protein
MHSTHMKMVVAIYVHPPRQNAFGVCVICCLICKMVRIRPSVLPKEKLACCRVSRGRDMDDAALPRV